MDAERNPWLPEWDLCDAQYDAPVWVDNEWKVLVNCQMEQSLIEMEAWRRAWMPVFDIKPDPYTADIAQTESAKYILDEFLDRENFYLESLLADQNRDKYWTGVYFCGLRVEIDVIKVPDKQEVGSAVWEVVYGKKKTHDEVRENYLMTPASVPLRYFRCDDKVLRQSDFRKAEDCFMVETLSPATFYQRYKDNPTYNQQAVNSATPIMQVDPAYGVQSIIWQIDIYHYFNRITKKYSIMVNRESLLLDTYMLYKHGQLPFSVGQCYPNVSCIYGFSIPRKVRVWKGYKNNILQNIIDWSRMWSGILLATSEDPTDGDLELIPGGVSLAKFNWGIQNMKQIDTRVDINWGISALGIIDDEVRKDTGIDQSAPVWPQANTLGQTEIIEENKALRQRASDQLRDIWLDRALTLTLSNIAQFAPHLLKKITEIKDKETGQVIGESAERPMIQIKNVTVKKKKVNWSEKVEEIIEDFGNYGYLELNPETLDWQLTVRVTTPSTMNKVLKSMAKDKADQLLAKRIEMEQILWPDRAEELLPWADVMEQYKQANGIETDMNPTTKKSQAKKKVKILAGKVRDLINLPQNANPNQAAIPQQNTGGMQAQPEWVMAWAWGMQQATMWI